MQGLAVLVDILVMITNVLVMLIIVQFVIGLLFAFNVVNSSNEFLRQVYQSINNLLEPVLRPVRNLLPQTGTLDLSPLVIIISAQVVLIILRGVIAGIA